MFPKGEISEWPDPRTVVRKTLTETTDLDTMISSQQGKYLVTLLVLP